MSPCISCVISSQDEYGHDRTWQSKWIDTLCPICGRGFEVGDHVLVDEDTITAYHVECYNGPEAALDEGVVI